MIGSTLKRYQPDRRYTVQDAETTGLNLFESRPWQWAWLIADAKQVYEQQDRYIWWKDLYVSPTVAALTGFNPIEYKARAEEPRVVLDAIEERLYDPSLDVVGHNFFYDGYIHNTLRRLCGKKPDWSWMTRMIDTNALSKALRKGWTPDLANFLAWQWKTTSCHERLKTKMGQMCVELGVEFDPELAHRAGYDVAKNRELYEKLKWAIEF